MDDSPNQPPQKFRPYRRPDSAGQTVADIERQEKIDRLRAQEADKDLFGVDEDDNIQNEKPSSPKKKHRFLRFLGWMLLIVILTGGGAAAGWYFVLRNSPKASQSAKQAQTPASTPAPAAETVEPTETHTSTAFLLQFSYPKTWKVTDNPDNTITAVSPAMQLKTAGASTQTATQTGQVVMTIRHKQPSLPEFKNGSATASIESEKINYTKPSQSQRGSTYLSFPNYVSSTAKGIDGVYVTGDNGYQKDQAIPMVDIAKSDPLITLTFRKCADAKCATPGEAVTLAASEWQNTTFVKPLKTMLQSIVAD
jgi:cytoskeletal protein RodZ